MEIPTKKQEILIGLLAGKNCDNCIFQFRAVFNVGHIGYPDLHEIKNCKIDLTPNQYGWCKKHEPKE